MSVIYNQAQTIPSGVEKENQMESQYKVLDLPKDLKELDYKEVYSEKSYEEYIQNYKLGKRKKYFYKFTKRLFDIIFALVLLIVLSPVMIIATIAICIEMIFCKKSRGRIFFLQKRIGKNDKYFGCLKFRTMKKTAPNNCSAGAMGDVKNQCTKVGYFLRRFSLDEIPQLFCVLIGTMSLVGPRPLISSLAQTNEMRTRLGVLQNVKPGITGWAQVNGRDDAYYKNKAVMDAEYVKKASIWFDIKILFLTVKVVFSKKGAI